MTAVRCYFCDTTIRKDQICSCEQAMEHRKRRQAEQNAVAERLLAKETTRRDHWRYTFAGMAMQGFMSSTPEEYGGFECERKLAEHSVKYADALLRQLGGGE